MRRFFAEAKGGIGCQAQAAAQAGGGLVPEPQGKVNFSSLLDAFLLNMACLHSVAMANAWLSTCITNASCC
jgi:hypothetical protein